jgi:hypothetical protein
MLLSMGFVGNGYGFVAECKIGFLTDSVEGDYPVVFVVKLGFFCELISVGALGRVLV